MKKTSKTTKICKLLNAKQDECAPEDSNYDVAYYELGGSAGLETGGSAGLQTDALEEITKTFPDDMGPLRGFDEIWDTDCYQGTCDSKGVVGFSDEDGNVGTDLDAIICGSHNKNMRLIPTSGQVVQIIRATDLSCGADQIVTAVMDLDPYCNSADYFKCLSLSTEWTIDTAKCTVVTLGGSVTKCPDSSGGLYYYVVGMWRKSARRDYLSYLKCCPVIRK
ncbi:Uncharacterised protein g3053 [Pycnogonum litorale]